MLTFSIHRWVYAHFSSVSIHLFYSYAKARQKPLEVSKAEEQIVKTLPSLYLQEDFRRWALDYLKRTNQIEITDRMQIFKNLSEKKESVNRSLSKLLELDDRGDTWIGCVEEAFDIRCQVPFFRTGILNAFPDISV